MTTKSRQPKSAKARPPSKASKGINPVQHSEGKVSAPEKRSSGAKKKLPTRKK